MQNRLFNFCFVVVLALTFINCANRGNITGGPKDLTPPKIIKTTPENYTTNFNAPEIRIYFDEYIKVKNLRKQLIISPPMENTPEITPLGTASKYIKIKILDTLKPNTTYAFNFGNSIVDNNEENPYTYYKYVFSTGDYIDSLTVKGRVLEAYNREVDPFISVNLYEKDSAYTDSIVYKETPKYVTNTLDSITDFTIDNLKAGTYKLVAIKDENSNNKFEQKSDKIGFYEEFITVPDTTAFYEIKLFKEKIDFKTDKPRLVSGEKIVFGFEGDDYKNMDIQLLSQVPADFKARIIKNQETDSLNYYYKPKLEVDSLLFKVTYKTVIDTFTVKIKDNKRDSLQVNAAPQNALGFYDTFKLSANIPIETFDKQQISIMNKDSVDVAFTTKLDTLNNTVDVLFDIIEDEQYRVQLLPKTITDFYGTSNDTLNYILRSPKEAGMGNTRIILKNATYPMIIQLVDDKGDVKYEQYTTKPEPLDFLLIKPSEYYIRAIFDTNKNKVYDSGIFLKGQQPERVSYSEKQIEIRVGWDTIEEFILK